MKKTLWLVLLALGLAACGGGATTSTLGTAVEAGDLDLSGLNLDVHQAPD
jgi:ABC-type glycerol-3-phosphate transport system substrate-binding protein